MKEAPNLPNEKERLKSLKSYRLLDTLPEEEYDNITELISFICNTPISLITLLDEERNFFKSHNGISFNESPRNISFCGHALHNKGEIFIIEDARVDTRFQDNPLVIENDVVFYAGVTLINKDRHSLGTLCVFDTRPRSLSESQIKTIKTMSRQIVNLFELRKTNLKLREFERLLLERNEQLKSFAGIVSHDLKSPLANISSLADLLKQEHGICFKDEGNQYITYIKESSLSLSNYIDGMLRFYKSDEIINESKEEASLISIFEQIDAIMFIDGAEFNYPKVDKTLYINRNAILQIFLNLIGNALKYNHSDLPHISVTFLEDSRFYSFAVKDNGTGIEKEKTKTIFDLFVTGEVRDRNGNRGSGIGLATTKNLITKLGGEIILESVVGKGSVFSFNIEK